MLTSIDVVDFVQTTDLGLPTPCEGWDLGDPLAHMTVQHRGFAAAATGLGADPAIWRVESVVDAVKTDPARAYSEAAHDVLDAFAADGMPEAQFALPEFGEGAVFPGVMAMGFHFVDYVVHGWDVATSLGVPYELPANVVEAVLPLALAVPDGDFRTLARSAVRASRRGCGRRRLRADTAASRLQAGMARRRTLIHVVMESAVHQLPGHPQ